MCSVERSAWIDSAARSAARRALRLTLTVYLRGLGPKTVPPPVQIGERLVPARARPVPFWRHGFAPPPRTIPRVLVACVPRRRAASSAITTSCTSGPLNGCSKTSASSVTALPPPRVCASGIGAHLHGRPLRARHGAAHEHQVAVGHQLDDRQALLGHAAAAHATRALDALEHARGGGRGADRARSAHVVRAVGLRAGGEVVALDRAL